MRDLHPLVWLCFLCLPLGMMGQNEADALRFSMTDIYGTARYSSMGGAFTALGGDASGSLLNPAGIAVYRNNTLSITPGYNERFTSSDYYNQTSEAGKSNLYIGSFSLTGVQPLNQAGKWRSTALSFGINRSYSFNDKTTVRGTDVPNTILQDYANIATDLGVNFADLSNAYPFDLYLLWENFLINHFEDEPTMYYHTGGVMPVDQKFETTTSGTKRETYFNVGGNYDDKLYIGAGIQIARITYNRTTTYSEYFDASDTTTALDEFSQIYYDDAEGRGYSANIGMIYRPIIPLRLGLSIKSPQVLNMEYQFESENITIEDGVSYSVLSPYILEYRYRIVSPFRITAGAAYTFGKAGLISIESDVVDHRMMSMRGRTDDDNFDVANDAINNNLRPALNLRIGGEYRFTPYWSGRAGFARYGNPYASSETQNGSFNVYSLGAGYRIDDFFIDASYQLKVSGSEFYLYDPNLVDPVSTTSEDHRIVLTVGFHL